MARRTAENAPPGPARRLLAVAGAAATAAALFAGPAQAYPAVTDPAGTAVDQGRDGDPLRTIAQAYRHTYPDLTPEEATAAAEAQRAGEDLKAAITDRWSQFGGGWFDPYTATYHLAVTTEASGAALAGIGDERGVAVSTPVVDRSIDDLQAAAEELRTGDSDLAHAADGNVGVDVTSNEVVAAVPADQAAALARAAPSGVTVVAAEDHAVEPDACTSRTDCDDFLAAGLVLRNGAGLHWCSLGFTARNVNDHRITLTAGHCSTGVAEDWTNGDSTIRDVGVVTDQINTGAADVTRIASTNDFYNNVNSGRIYIGPPANWEPVVGDTFLLANDVVCLSASFTNPDRFGNPCATVTDPSDPDVRNMVRIDGYDACGGDSGGGWYQLTPTGDRYAVALHSRSIDGCNATPAISWASPITAFYQDLRFRYERG